MAIEKKTGLFYDLTVRGNHDPKNGELGAITTYMLQTGTAIVDTDTQTLVAPYQPDPAVDLTKEQAVEFLGKKFGSFVEQTAALKAAANATVDDLRERLAVSEAKVADLSARLSGLITATQDAVRTATPQ